jgi:hypothetical protein
MRTTLAEQADERPFRGAFAPNVAQVEVVRGHLANYDTATVYLAMNR